MGRLLSNLICVALALYCMSTTPLFAQTAQPNRCNVEEARQFDFWIGDWDVFDKDGSLAGTNLVTPLYEGCALHESWKANDMAGQSFNRFDAGRRLWHQTWLDSNGGILIIEGKFDDGVMTLSDATLPGKIDPLKINEISWSKLPDGSVRQHWRRTKDGGKTWSTAFDGKYVRSTRSQPWHPTAKNKSEPK